jgi:hypothetical protein
MKKIFSVIFLLLIANYLQAQQSHVFKSPKAIKNSIGEFVTESNVPLPERSYHLKTFKTSDGGTATLLKFEQEESENNLVTNNKVSVVFKPNITDGIVKVQVNNSVASMFQISIYNLLGTLFFSTEANNGMQLDLSKLPSGIYFAKCLVDDEVITQRIIKE